MLAGKGGVYYTITTLGGREGERGGQGSYVKDKWLSYIIELLCIIEQWKITYNVWQACYVIFLLHTYLKMYAIEKLQY